MNKNLKTFLFFEDFVGMQSILIISTPNYSSHSFWTLVMSLSIFFWNSRSQTWQQASPCRAISLAHLHLLPPMQTTNMFSAHFLPFASTGASFLSRQLGLCLKYSFGKDQLLSCLLHKASHSPRWPWMPFVAPMSFELHFEPLASLSQLQGLQASCSMYDKISFIDISTQ